MPVISHRLVNTNNTERLFSGDTDQGHHPDPGFSSDSSISDEESKTREYLPSEEESEFRKPPDPANKNEPH